MLVAGRYRLLEPVGAGGMGRVWLARDEMLARDVAVKEFVPPDWMTDEEKARLRDRTLREAQSAGRLNHPHVVRVYDVVHAEGLPWIVMEYVPSRSLHQVINEDGPFAPVAAARIGLDVLDALTAAHRAGVLHRDVKPHNVLIGTDGRVVLTDFGLATFVDDGSITGPGLVVGSPQYVSPERARDGASTVESDLWSLGATLYAAVEGRSPYARDSAMATLMALATEPPDPPVRAGLLSPVLTGLLRHDPAARLTAIELDRRLRMIVAAAPDASPDVTSRPGVAPRAGVPSPRRVARDGQANARVVPDLVADPEPDRTNRSPATAGQPAAAPALRRGNQTVIPALPVQRPRSAPISPAPASVVVPASTPAPTSTPSPVVARPRLVAAGVAVLALLGAGGIVAGFRSQRDGRSAVSPPGGVSVGLAASAVPTSPAAPGFTPAACDGPAPRSAPTVPQRGASRGVGAFGLIDGWSYYAAGGFHIPVPDGWQVRKVGTTYCFLDPTDARVLALDTGRNPAGDPVKACRTESARLAAGGALPGYQELSIVPKPLLNKAAEWEYRYVDADGVRLHARTRWFVATNGKAFAISWATREVAWGGDRANVDMAFSTFYVDQIKVKQTSARSS
ncbi:protein kinase domain-containing protein [Micromonosporaceae bacterium Da 78-11]